MKYLFLLLCCANVFGQDLTINLNHNQKVINQLLIPVWNSIDYDYDLKKSSKNEFTNLSEAKGNLIQFKLLSSKIKLGAPRTPLLRLNLKKDNQAQINWKLNGLDAVVKAKIRFKYKKFGISLTHDEYFDIHARSLNNATSNIKINKNNDLLNFELLSNSNFSLKHVSVKPKNGIGEALRFIFDNIFSEGKVDKFITKEVNKQIKKLINDSNLIGQVETSLNDELTRAQKTNIKIQALATSLKLAVKDFNFDQENLLLSTDALFTDYYKPHPCANEMISSKSDTQISFKLVENIINNVIVNDNKVRPPLLCVGYQRAENGKFEGGTLRAKYMAKRFQFQYWIKPVAAVQYTYDQTEQIVSIATTLKAILKTKGYPKIYAYKDRVLTTVLAKFKIRHTQNGLVLEPIKLKLASIKGNVKIRFARFLPKIPLPLNFIRKILEKEINKMIKKDYAQVIIVPDHLELMDGLTLDLEDYSMESNNHKIKFNVLTN